VICPRVIEYVEKKPGGFDVGTEQKGFLKPRAWLRWGLHFVGAEAQEKKQKEPLLEPVRTCDRSDQPGQHFRERTPNFYFSRGNTLPIRTMPFGMAHWTLQSRALSPWMFQPGDRRIQGFRCTHQLSPWLSDYGHATSCRCSQMNRILSRCRSSSYRPVDALLLPAVAAPEVAALRADVELVPF